MKPLTVIRAAAVARTGIGISLALGARQILRAMLRDERPSASFVLFARTVGIRDALFGLGCLLSTLDASRARETRRWIQLWLANEAADVVAAIASSRQLGAGGAAAAAAPPAVFVAVDVWTLRRLAAG